MIRRLSASQADFYKQLVKGLPMGMAVIHLKDSRDARTWKLVASNAIASYLGGLLVADFLSLPVVENPSKNNSSRHAALFRLVAEKKKPKRVGQMRKENKPGAAEVLEVLACPLAGNCVGILFEDVSRQKKTLRELMEVESRLAQMRESARAIQWRADPATLEFTEVSKEARNILGYWIERWEKESNFWKNHTHADDWNLVEEGCSQAALGAGGREFECRMFHADGHILWFHAYVQLASFRAGHRELSGVMVDITAQKRAEEGARQLSQRVIQAQEEERRRISRELHDSIGQYLTGLKFSIAAARSDEQCTEEMAEKLNECAQLVRVCMEEIRSVSNMLHPPLLDILGLVPALRWYGQNFSERSAILLELDAPQEMERLEADTELTLFRIFQECLTNVQRHAKTSHARVRLNGDARTVVLEVEDSGVGLPPGLFQQLERNGSGIGLLKMRERVSELHGKIEFHSNGKGTLVRAQIPRRKAQVAGSTFPAKTNRATANEARAGFKKVSPRSTEEI